VRDIQWWCGPLDRVTSGLGATILLLFLLFLLLTISEFSASVDILDYN
jgi:succinate-acetate transporter protein